MHMWNPRQSTFPHPAISGRLLVQEPPELSLLAQTSLQDHVVCHSSQCLTMFSVMFKYFCSLRPVDESTSFHPPGVNKYMSSNWNMCCLASHIASFAIDLVNLHEQNLIKNATTTGRQKQKMIKTTHVRGGMQPQRRTPHTTHAQTTHRPPTTATTTNFPPGNFVLKPTKQRRA